SESWNYNSKWLPQERVSRVHPYRDRRCVWLDHSRLSDGAWQPPRVVATGRVADHWWRGHWDIADRESPPRHQEDRRRSAGGAKRIEDQQGVLPRKPEDVLRTPQQGEKGWTARDRI